MRVLVIGGAGYIGSHAVRKLIEEGNDVVVLDSLYTGHRKAIDKKAKFYQGDIEDTNLVSKILRDENIDAVMHFAAYSLVPESVKKPLKYYDNNVSGMISLLQAMDDAKVKYLSLIHISEPTRKEENSYTAFFLQNKIGKYYI
ncbi:NAD-dependent epimerase/dehydratase family protein [Lactobacillus gasseri]|uniref:NAD-dependent epimerase/dehydratase family protein n=1 Tax=Lactobacillus gasseri TaxID=1596 RepID=UPI000AFAB581